MSKLGVSSGSKLRAAAHCRSTKKAVAVRVVKGVEKAIFRCCACFRIEDASMLLCSIKLVTRIQDFVRVAIRGTAQVQTDLALETFLQVANCTITSSIYSLPEGHCRSRDISQTTRERSW